MTDKLDLLREANSEAKLSKSKISFVEDDILPFQRLDKPMAFEDILTKANATTLEELLKIVNGGSDAMAVSSLVGTLIDPGKVGVLIYNGTVQLIGPGRYVFPNPRAQLVEVIPLTQNPIRYESLTIVRVAPGQIGLASNGGNPVLLGEGLHVYNSRVFQFKEFKGANQNYINHAFFHVVRVPAGNYALVRENNVPKLLPEGNHVTISTIFAFDELKPMNQPYLTHGTIHILQVPKGKVALVTESNHPKLLGDGTHFINSSNFSYAGMKDINTEVITHGTITRFRVRKGQIGLAWHNNQPLFFEEGLFEKDDPNFTFVKTVDAGEKTITLGSKKIITVFDGEVGVSFLNGKLRVLHPDRHVIESAEHIFSGFLSTQQQCLRLYNEKQGKEHLVCETKDFVEIGIKADVFYRVANAEKVLLIVGKDNVVPLVRETAVATLNSIIRNTSLAEVAQNKEVSARSEKKILEKLNEHGMPSAPLFFDKVHDEFLSKLHDSFMEQYGIDMCNIRIESFKIINQELAANISKQVLTTTQTTSQLANLAGQTEIATAEQKRNAEVARIKAEGDSVRLRTENDARNQAVTDTAKAEADAQLVRAKAEAQALEVKARAEASAFEVKSVSEAMGIEVKAEAEAKCILKKAEAEAQRARVLAQTKLGGQIAMFQLYTNMVQNCMEGVQKVMYLPSDAANNPFSFFALNASGQPFTSVNMFPESNPEIKK